MFDHFRLPSPPATANKH